MHITRSKRGRRSKCRNRLRVCAARCELLVVGRESGQRIAWSRGLTTVKTCRNHRHANFVAQRVIDGHTKDDVGIGVHNFGNERCCLVDFVNAQVGSTLNRQQYAMRAVDGGVQQGRGNCRFGRLHRAFGTTGGTDTHQGGSGVLHDRAHVCKVEVNQAGVGDQVGNTLDTGQEDLIGDGEGLGCRNSTVGDGQQSVVGDNNQSVHLGAKLGDAGFGLLPPATSFEAEGLSDNTHGQGAD